MKLHYHKVCCQVSCAALHPAGAVLHSVLPNIFQEIIKWMDIFSL